MSASIEDVCEELQALGFDTQVTSGESNGLPWQFLSVFGEGERRPVATVWPPTGGDEGWLWGSSFQWGSPADADAQAVASRISETLPEASQADR